MPIRPLTSPDIETPEEPASTEAPVRDDLERPLGNRRLYAFKVWRFRKSA
jgi:hypothetical protein